jgi:type I restriction-modification system DNA methylase subunit
MFILPHGVLAMPSVNNAERPPPDHQKELVKLINTLGYRHGHWQVFADFVEAAAISVSNAVDMRRREKREERYLQVVKRYKPDELARFPEMLASLTMALGDETTDVLGRTFHDLELHNKWAGQYFSPYPLCRMMARMTLADRGDVEARISERGFVTAQEPAAGSGAMIIALAHEMQDAGINYQQHLHVTAVDVDTKCVHMSYRA